MRLSRHYVLPVYCELHVSGKIKSLRTLLEEMRDFPETVIARRPKQITDHTIVIMRRRSPPIELVKRLDTDYPGLIFDLIYRIGHTEYGRFSQAHNINESSKDLYKIQKLFKDELKTRTTSDYITLFERLQSEYEEVKDKTSFLQRMQPISQFSFRVLYPSSRSNYEIFIMAQFKHIYAKMMFNKFVLTVKVQLYWRGVINHRKSRAAEQSRLIMEEMKYLPRMFPTILPDGGSEFAQARRRFEENLKLL